MLLHKGFWYMIFTTLDFIVFFAVTLMAFYLTSHNIQRIVLLLANYVFYMWLNPLFGVFLASATVITYFAARAIESKALGFKKLWAAVGVCAVLSVLSVFKYADFALSGLGLLFGRQFDRLELILPQSTEPKKSSSLCFFVGSYHFLASVFCDMVLCRRNRLFLPLLLPR